EEAEGGTEDVSSEQSGGFGLRRLLPGRGDSVRGRGREVVESWRRYRENQLNELAESNRLQRELIERGQLPPAQGTLPGWAKGAPAGPGAPRHPAGESSETAEPIVERRRELMTVTSPFMFGFFGALGVLVAWWLAQNIGRLSSVITFVLIAIFL